MKLYPRTVLGLIIAFVLTFLVLGYAKSVSLDPGRRAHYLELQAPIMRLAAERLHAADDPKAELERIKEDYGSGFSIETQEREKAAGWFTRGTSTYAYQTIAGAEQVVFGPLPNVDPDAGLIRSLALTIPVLMAGLVGLVIVLPLIRRIRMLERVTRRLADGDLSARMSEHGGDEISSLVCHVNRMGSEIEKLVKSKQELLQAVSHEFRTPAARIRFDLEMLEDASDPAEVQSRLKAIDEHLVEMDELVDELIAYTRLEQHPDELPMSEIDPAAVAQALIASAEKLREDVSLTLECEEKTAVWAHERYLRRALHNLLMNGLRYAESEVRIVIRSADEHTEISVIDDGPGIAPEDRIRVFAPFIRLDNQRNCQGKGSGLGLAIVERICRWHRATIEVSSAGMAGGGTAMVMRWPQGAAVERP